MSARVRLIDQSQKMTAAAMQIAEKKVWASAWFREVLEARGSEPCIPSSRSRKVPYAYDTALYRQRHKVENLFAKLKVWRRIATRYDRCLMNCRGEAILSAEWGWISL
jgi:transposase